MKQNLALCFSRHSLPASYPRMERGHPLLLQRKQTQGQRPDYCPRSPGQPDDPEWAAGREGAAHVMTVSTKAHRDLSGLHKPSPIHPPIHAVTGYFSARGTSRQPSPRRQLMTPWRGGTHQSSRGCIPSSPVSWGIVLLWGMCLSLRLRQSPAL